MSDAVARPPGEGTDLFDEEYFRHAYSPVPYDRSRPEWALTSGRVAGEVIRTLRPGSVLDAGCGMGFLVEAFQDRGVPACGIDVSRYAISRVRPDMTSCCRTGSITDPIDGRYDLVVCTEVLGYLTDDQIRVALRNLAASTDTVLFSSAPPEDGEIRQPNPRPPLVWMRLFAEHGFSPDITYDASFVAPHAMLFRRQPPHPPEVLQLFAECLRGRRIAADRERARDEVAAVEAKLAATQAEAEQQAEYFERIRHLQDQLMKQAQELSSEVLRRANEPPGVTTNQLADLESRLRNDLVGKQELHPDLRRVVSEHTELRAQVARLERRITELERTVQGLSAHLDSVLHSRIWRSLVSAGGLMLRLTSRK